MKKVEINGKTYEILENIGNCLNTEELKEKITDYFDNFDYIFGDFSYDKVRLKGYNDSTNKKANKINNIKGLEDYKKNYCSYGAKTFLLKKVS
ncbi:MAG: DUF1027 domain-containing protein [Tenericutes bacterium]|nr:DUF1027 domain-containing protein [Mycoplasmatota bacterium]